MIRFIALILVCIATGCTQEPSGCHVENPFVQSIRISDAQVQFQDLLEDLQVVASKLDIQVDVNRHGSYPIDCDTIDRRLGSGVYWIHPAEYQNPIRVYCDMETDGGGWLVIQRREDSSVNFNRGWSDYQRGFGSKYSEYWIGNENLYWLTAQRNYELRVDMEDFYGDRKSAVYDNFRVGDSSTRYQLLIGNYARYRSTAGDSMSYHDRAPFSTPEVDNDLTSPGSCATHFQSGWWFANCYDANLNGIYRFDGEESNPLGIVWSEWRGLNISLKATEMKIRPPKVTTF